MLVASYLELGDVVRLNGIMNLNRLQPGRCGGGHEQGREGSMMTGAGYLDNTTAGPAPSAGALVCKDQLPPTHMIGILVGVIGIVLVNIRLRPHSFPRPGAGSWAFVVGGCYVSFKGHCPLTWVSKN